MLELLQWLRQGDNAFATLVFLFLLAVIVRYARTGEVF